MSDYWLLILIHSLTGAEFQRLMYLHGCIAYGYEAPDWAKL